tara:strand:- start:292 stop:1101 length:810 start_codon:yes stop_codon:yes gene_type:complete
VSANPAEKQTFDKVLVRQSFGLAAESYNQFTSLQRTIGDRLFAGIAGSEQRLMSALDIGSGTGYLTEKINQLDRVNQLYALDICSQMLKQTQLNMHGLQPLRLICADAERLPLDDSIVGLVCSNLAYQWCSDLQRAFDESYRVLQPQGSFVISTFGEKTLHELKDSWGNVDQAVHVNTFVDIETITGYLQKAGFKDISLQSEDIVRYYQTPKDLMLELKGMGAHNINKGRKPGLTGVHGFKSMLDMYESRRTDKGIPATFQALYAYANK